MRTLLCGINSKFIHSNLAVYSLYESAKIYKEQYDISIGEISVIEYTINDVYETVLYDIMSTKPDVVAFSVYIWNVTFIEKLTSDIRKVSPNCIVILGGPEVSYGTENMDLKYDYVIIGEGERAFFALLAKLNNESFIPDDSFGFTIKEKTVIASPIKELSEIPLVYNDNNIVLFDNRIIYYESTRGCPFSCAYCLSSVNKGVRYLELERVYRDVDFFLRSGVKQVKFVDRTFNCNPTRAFNILSYIITNSNRDDINFHFEVGADLFTEEIIELLSKAPSGLIQFEAGIQSTYEKALAESVRKTDMEKCLNNIKKIVGMGNINMHVDLIAGLPYESLDIFKRSFNDAYLLKSHQLQLGFLKILKGTKFNSLIGKHGYVFSDNPPYEILSNSYMSFEDISTLKKIEYVLDRLYNSGRFNETLNRLVSLYDNPYAMYDSIFSYFEENGYIHKAISSRNLYDIFFSYITYAFPDLIDEFAYTLLFDFYASDKSEVVPLCLKYLLKNDKKADLSYVCHLDKSQVKNIRFIGNDVFVFDYSNKNRVNDRYDFFALY